MVLETFFVSDCYKVVVVDVVVVVVEMVVVKVVVVVVVEAFENTVGERR